MSNDFSDCSSVGWATYSDEHASLGCVDGAYRFLFKKPSVQSPNARIFFDKGVQSLIIESDATRRAGPKRLTSKSVLIYGVGCWATPKRGYVFLLSPDGWWGIERIPGTHARPLAQIAGSTDRTVIRGLSKTNRLRGVCTGGQGLTTLAFYVNDKLVAAHDDKSGLRLHSFPGFGFFVVTTKAGTDVRFDNLVVRAASGQEVRRARAASKQQAAIAAMTPTERRAAKLCKSTGIRYYGATPQGAAMCFTLSSDGRNLVESYWSFVAASKCPQRSTGTTGIDYRDYPERLDSSGHVEDPDGMIINVHGATASGTLWDTEICPGKRFHWTAHRIAASP